MADATEDLPIKVSVGGTAEFERIMQIMSSMLTAAADDHQKHGDLGQEQHFVLTTAAAGVLAGYLTGVLIATGPLRDRDKRRSGEMLMRNFRQGIRIGKLSVMNVAGRIVGEGHA